MRYQGFGSAASFADNDRAVVSYAAFQMQLSDPHLGVPACKAGAPDRSGSALDHKGHNAHEAKLVGCLRGLGELCGHCVFEPWAVQISTSSARAFTFTIHCLTPPCGAQRRARRYGDVEQPGDPDRRNLPAADWPEIPDSPRRRYRHPGGTDRGAPARRQRTRNPWVHTPGPVRPVVSHESRPGPAPAHLRGRARRDGIVRNLPGAGRPGWQGDSVQRRSLPESTPNFRPPTSKESRSNNGATPNESAGSTPLTPMFRATRFGSWELGVGR